jgi:hypothetical protein
MTEAPYAVIVGPHVAADGHEVYALCCGHGSASTTQVEQMFSPNFGLGLLLALAVQNPGVTVEELSWIAMRLLLGWALAESAGCRCGERAFVLVRSDDGVRVEDVE